MQIEKRKLLRIIDALPDKVDIEEVLYRLYLRQKLEAAEEDVREGRLVSHEDVVAENERWFSE
jgi:predicted transcriptional regulator